MSAAEHPGQDGIHSGVLDAETIRSSSLYNEDLAPIPASRRSWGTYNYAALWIAMSVNIPTYMLASGDDRGRNELEAGHLHRVFGKRPGARADASQRACGRKVRNSLPGICARVVWSAGRECSGRSARAGGLRMVRHQCLDWRRSHQCDGRRSGSLVANVFPRRVDLLCADFGCCTSSSSCEASGRIRFLQGVTAPFLLLIGVALLAWAVVKAGGFGPMLAAPSKFQTFGEFFRFFIPSLTGVVGFWATVALNIPDFTRYARSQRAQVVGQALGLADDDDALFLHRHRRHFGDGDYFRAGDLGSRAGARAPRKSVRGRRSRCWRCCWPR